MTEDDRYRMFTCSYVSEIAHVQRRQVVCLTVARKKILQSQAVETVLAEHEALKREESQRRSFCPYLLLAKQSLVCCFAAAEEGC